MKSAYFLEGQHYSFAEIKEKFSSDDETVKKRINLLRRCNVLKIVKKEKSGYSDLLNQELIINQLPEDSPDFSYAFSFVGIILIDDLVLKCYPKYLESTDGREDTELTAKLKTLIKVIRKYSEQGQVFSLYSDGEERKPFNRLEVSLYILHDYFENGLYTNQKENIELNGECEILWGKTIDETFAFIKNGTPYYLDFYTRETVNNELDFIRRLHAAIITKCSEDLKNAEILNLFDLNGAFLTSESIEDIGDVDFIKYRLEKELKTQFITKKQNLLKILYTYISEEDYGKDFESFSFYGTNSFNLVWEKACADIFDSVRDKTFCELKKNNIIEEKNISNPNYDPEIRDFGEEFLRDSEPLKNLIEKIKWTFNDTACHAAETLEPDIISIYDRRFFILDAKYYCIKNDKNRIYSQPGIQDVVKQFAYHRAFCKFIEEFKFSKVVNAFLVPKQAAGSSQKKIRLAGKAELALMQDYAEKTLSPVQIVELEPEFVYSHYLNSDKITEELCKLFIEEKGTYGDVKPVLQQVAEPEVNTVPAQQEGNTYGDSRMFNGKH